MKTGTSLRKGGATLCVSTVAILLAGVAVAEGPQGGMGKRHKMHGFEDIDANGDGKVVAAEFYEARAKHMAERAKAGGKMKNAANAPTFEDLDLDDDGAVSPDEFAVHQAEMREKHRGGGKHK